MEKNKLVVKVAQKVAGGLMTPITVSVNELLYNEPADGEAMCEWLVGSGPVSRLRTLCVKHKVKVEVYSHTVVISPQ